MACRDRPVLNRRMWRIGRRRQIPSRTANRQPSRPTARKLRSRAARPASSLRVRRRAEPKPQQWQSTATTLAGIVSVLLVAAGLFYTNAANREQQRLSVEGQTADRFTAAIDQLGQEGTDKLSI